MREILTNLFLDLLEVNVVAAVVILFLSFLGGKLRKRYGSGWMKIMWILLAVRLLIPYNFSIVPLAGISFAGAAPSDSRNAETETNAAVHLDLSQAADGSSQQDISAGILQNDAAQMIHGQPFRENADHPGGQQESTDQIVSGKKSGRGKVFHYTYVEILSAVWIMGVF